MEASAATGRNGPVGRSVTPPICYPPGNDHLFLPTYQRLVPPNQIMIKIVKIWRFLFKITPYNNPIICIFIELSCNPHDESREPQHISPSDHTFESMIFLTLTVEDAGEKNKSPLSSGMPFFKNLPNRAFQPLKSSGGVNQPSPHLHHHHLGTSGCTCAFKSSEG